MATKDLTEWASVKDSAETQANSGLIHPNLIETRWSEASTLRGIQSVWASRHVTICHDYSLLPRLSEDRISKETLKPLGVLVLDHCPTDCRHQRDGRVNLLLGSLLGRIQV